MDDWTTDPFSTRYGYIPGRCNAYKRGHGKTILCKSYPMKGRRRCRFHGGKITPEHIAKMRSKLKFFRTWGDTMSGIKHTLFNFMRNKDE